MRKLFISVKKESILLSRDVEGIALLLVMPLILVIIIALLQHRAFDNLSEIRIPLVIIDNDNDSLGIMFRRGIHESDIFVVTEFANQDHVFIEQVKESVANGKYQIGVVIPENTTKQIKRRVTSLIQQQLPNNFSVTDSGSANSDIILYFDPITKESFKDVAESKLREFASKTESIIIFEAYSKVIDALTNQTSTIIFPDNPVLSLKEESVSEYTGGKTPNAVQHNVPAWALFGMFLICIPIAGNIIRERESGCLNRLKTMPVSYFIIVFSKSLVFVGICLIQTFLILLVGIYLMPALGLPQLSIHNNIFALILISASTAFAATAYGVTIGSIAKTQIQASAFGSVSTIILAAIGGVWIPVNVMSDTMRAISSFSPMNWGIQGFYKVFLRNCTTQEVLPDIFKLLLFSIVCLLISSFVRMYVRRKSLS